MKHLIMSRTGTPYEVGEYISRIVAVHEEVDRRFGISETVRTDDYGRQEAAVRN